jgi:site-specific recombinase XerD
MEKDHLANKTICNYYIVLSSLWTWAVKNEYAKEHVVRKIHKPKYIKKKLPSFTEREVRLIYSVCTTERDKAIVMVLLDTGLRASELCALTVDDWWPGNLHVRNGKGGKERDVPISEVTENAIFNHLKKRSVREQGVDSGSALFTSDYPTIPLSYESLRYFMKKLQKRSSVHDVHAHKFRHTFAVNFLRNNGNVYALKEIMGHENLETTERYLDLVHSDFTDAHRIASPVTNMRLGNSQ